MKIPLVIYDAWLKPLNTSNVQSIGGGLSSSRVWRLSTSTGVVCLKAWPLSSMSVGRLEDLNDHLALLNAAGLEFIPSAIKASEGRNWIECENYLWEASTWMPGEPDLSDRVSDGRCRAAAEALALVHHVWRERGVQYQVPPGVVQRLDRLHAARQSLRPMESRGESTVLPGLETSAQQLANLSQKSLIHLKQSGSRLHASLQEMAYRVATHFAVRDLHSEHLLFTGNRLTGMIDFGAARMDDPLLDLVRMLGSLLPFDRTTRYATLDCYVETLRSLDDPRAKSPVLPTSEKDREGFQNRYRVLDETSCLLSALQWFEWMVLQPGSVRCSTEEAMNRWKRHVDRLEAGEW